MIQRAPAVADIEREIVARITGAMRPWRIVLFGSRARGGATEESDYDVYVEVDAPDDDALRAAHHQIWSLLRGITWTLDLKTNPRGTIDRRRDDPGTIEWDVAREGIVLYADTAAGDIAPSKRVREGTFEPPESVAEWLDSGARNLEMRADLQATGKDYSPEVCWLSHQAGEKFLKALIVSRRVRPPRTHSLVELLQAARAAGAQLRGLDADCELLTKHAVEPRYPKGMHLNQEDARAAAAAADRVIAAVRELLPRR